MLTYRTDLVESMFMKLLECCCYEDGGNRNVSCLVSDGMRNLLVAVGLVVWI
jgi:hypothetical protein